MGYPRRDWQGNATRKLTTALKLPTLTTQDAKNSGHTASHQKRHTPMLAAQIHTLPTLRAGRVAGPDSNGVLPEIFRGGLLNPMWCEWFMGTPIGWTALEPLETESFQQWSKSF